MARDVGLPGPLERFDALAQWARTLQHHEGAWSIAAGINRGGAELRARAGYGLPLGMYAGAEAYAVPTRSGPWDVGALAGIGGKF